MSAAKVGMTDGISTRALVWSHSGIAVSLCLGIAVLELNLKLTEHILFESNYLKFGQLCTIKTLMWYWEILLPYFVTLKGYWYIPLSHLVTLPINT
jgi:hypothetical protein